MYTVHWEGAAVIERSVEHFYYRYGRYRLEQILTILNDGKPAPQERIADLLKISKSAVSEMLKKWGIKWRAEFPEETTQAIKILLEFDDFSIQRAKQRVTELTKRTPILVLNERNHRA